MCFSVKSGMLLFLALIVPAIGQARPLTVAVQSTKPFFAASSTMPQWASIGRSGTKIVSVGGKNLDFPVELPGQLVPIDGVALVTNDYQTTQVTFCFPMTKSASIKKWVEAFPANFPVENVHVQGKWPKPVPYDNSTWAYRVNVVRGTRWLRLLTVRYDLRSAQASAGAPPEYQAYCKAVLSQGSPIVEHPTGVIVLIIQFGSDTGNG